MSCYNQLLTTWCSGEMVFDDVVLSRYCIFQHYQPFQPLFQLKMADFEGDAEVWGIQYFNLQQKYDDSG